MKRILFLETNTTSTGAQAMKLSKEMGYHVHFWTNDPSQYDSIKYDNPTDLADEIKVIDTYDAAKMIKAIKNEQIQYHGVLAFDDYHLMPAAEIAKKLHLNGHETKSLSLVRNKNLMRDYLKNLIDKSGFYQPKFQTINEDHSSHLYNDNYEFPLVFKPIDDSGSNGVRICHNKNELIEAFNVEKERFLNPRGYKLQRSWLAEEYISGDEYSAEMLYTKEGWKLVSVTLKETYGEHAIESGHVSSKSIKPIPDIEDRCIKLLNLFNLDFGAAHIEFKLKDSKPYLIEINPRLAGDYIPALVKTATGVDMVEHLLKQSLGIDAKINFSTDESAAIKFFIPKRPGIYKKAANLKEIMSYQGIIQIDTVNLPVHFTQAKSSYERIAFAIAKAKRPETAFKAAEKAISDLRWDVSYSN